MTISLFFSSWREDVRIKFKEGKKKEFMKNTVKKTCKINKNEKKAESKKSKKKKNR